MDSAGCIVLFLSLSTSAVILKQKEAMTLGTMELILLIFVIINLFIGVLILIKKPQDSSREAFSRLREDMLKQAREDREELRLTLRDMHEQMNQFAGLQQKQFSQFHERLESFNQSIVQILNKNETRMTEMREGVQKSVENLQKSNEVRLEQMRVTVDEKLNETLEKRLGESFKTVSEQLENVYKGLGEMQSLATGVGDLKKVLTNVKTRGTWGEMQLSNLLEQVLTPEQYTANVATKRGSNERVEFAIKLPGKELGKDDVVYLPIDAKFPQEDYQRLMDTQDADSQILAGDQLEKRIRAEAKDIAQKYIDPPNTTDFAILFLPVEGLYAEVLRRPGLCDALQRDHRVVLAGPTTLGALLNSLQMGFRTIAIEQRSSEVWKVLGEVKTQFGKFADILTKTQKKLQEATNTVEDAARKTRTIQSKLRTVEAMPIPDGEEILTDLLSESTEIDE